MCGLRRDRLSACVVGDSKLRQLKAGVGPGLRASICLLTLMSQGQLPGWWKCREILTNNPHSWELTGLQSTPPPPPINSSQQPAHGVKRGGGGDQALRLKTRHLWSVRQQDPSLRAVSPAGGQGSLRLP